MGCILLKGDRILVDPDDNHINKMLNNDCRYVNMGYKKYILFVPVESVINKEKPQ